MKVRGSIFAVLLALVSANTSALTFYSVDPNADTLVSIDSDTGATSVIGSLGFDAGLVVDLATVGSRLFALYAPGNLGPVDLHELDPLTGASLSSARVRTSSGEIAYGEGLTNSASGLIIGFNPGGGIPSFSGFVGELALDGMITNEETGPNDVDALGVDESTGVIYGADGFVGGAGVLTNFFTVSRPPLFENIFFEDIMQAEPAFIEKAAEGLVLAFFNQGEVCTCPSRALVQESIYEPFMAEVMKKIVKIKRGNPLDTETMVGAQASEQQYEKILSYLKIAQEEGAELLTGGAAERLEGDLSSGYYIQPTLLKGHNKMRVFQEEIFGPVVGVTTFKDEAEALAIANDSEFGLGAGLWTRDINRAYRMGRAIKAGRVWTNCYHLYPAHAAFGGYKKSGVGRENHKMMLDHYQQTKNLLVSYDINPLGFF